MNGGIALDAPRSIWRRPKKDFISPHLRRRPQALRSAMGRLGKSLDRSSANVPGREWKQPYDFARQLPLLQNAQGRQQDLRLLQPADGRKERSQRHLAPAVLDEGAA